MAYGLNKVQLIGNLGADPEIRDIGDDRKVANIRIATTEKKGGEEYTEWHRVSVFSPMAEIIEAYVSKGDRIYVEGSIRTRTYGEGEEKKYFTEINVGGYNSKLLLLSGGTPTAFETVSEEEADLPL